MNKKKYTISISGVCSEFIVGSLDSFLLEELEPLGIVEDDLVNLDDLDEDDSEAVWDALNTIEFEEGDYDDIFHDHLFMPLDMDAANYDIQVCEDGNEIKQNFSGLITKDLTINGGLDGSLFYIRVLDQPKFPILISYSIEKTTKDYELQIDGEFERDKLFFFSQELDDEMFSVGSLFCGPYYGDLRELLIERTMVSGKYQHIYILLSVAKFVADLDNYDHGLDISDFFSYQEDFVNIIETELVYYNMNYLEFVKTQFKDVELEEVDQDGHTQSTETCFIGKDKIYINNKSKTKEIIVIEKYLNNSKILFEMSKKSEEYSVIYELISNYSKLLSLGDCIDIIEIKSFFEEVFDDLISQGLDIVEKTLEEFDLNSI